MHLPRLAPVGLAPVVLAAALAAPAAAAQTAPKTQLSRDPTGNLVVIQVHRVDVPDRLPGDCRVAGVVGRVVQGRAYHVGQLVTIAVPCSPQPVIDRGPARRAPIGPPPRGGLDPQVLKSSTAGLALLDDDGRLIWDPQPAPHSPGEPDVRGQAYGYRILDPVLVPTAPRHAL